MGILIGFLLGAGLFLVWRSCWLLDRDLPRRGSDGSAGPGEGADGRRGGIPQRLQDTLRQAGVEQVSVQALLATCAGLGVTAFLGVLALSEAVPIAGCFAVMVAWSPLGLVRFRARHRRAVLRELWPEVVDDLSSAVRAGLSLPEALVQLGERGPEPLRPAFRTFARDYRATGRFGEALDRLKDGLAEPVADRLCEALRITREVGGSDLGRVLRSLSSFLRDDARTRAELEARQSWTVNAARLAVAAPWVVLALLATQPESVRAYDNATGAGVLVAGAVLSAVAYRLMLRVGRLPEERRVLR